MSISKGELLDFANGIKELIVENGRLKHNNESSAEYIKLLEEENRKLKYEYPDSLLNRDKPLPVKWARKGVVRFFCPKCGMSVTNWYRYCYACGQRIAEENLLPEMEIKEDEQAHSI